MTGRFIVNQGVPDDALVVWWPKDFTLAELQWPLQITQGEAHVAALFNRGLSNVQIATVFGVMAAASRVRFKLRGADTSETHAWFEWYEGASGTGCSSIGAIGAALEGMGWAGNIRTRLSRALVDATESEETWPLANVEICND